MVLKSDQISVKLMAGNSILSRAGPMISDACQYAIIYYNRGAEEFHHIGIRSKTSGSENII